MRTAQQGAALVSIASRGREELCRARVRFIMEFEARQDELSDELLAFKKAWWQLREIEPWLHSAGEQSLSHAYVLLPMLA